MHRLRTVSILAFIYILVFTPIVTRVEGYLFILFASNTQNIGEQIALRQFIFNALAIRSLALSVLLIATAMAFYYCILANKKEMPC